MAWSAVLTIGLTQGIPALFKLFKSNKQYGDVVKALKRCQVLVIAAQKNDSEGGRNMTTSEIANIALQFLIAVVEFAEARER